MRHHNILAILVATCVLLLAAQEVALGLPAATVSVTPEAHMTGGAGALIPNVSNTAVTTARVDNGRNPPGAVTVGFKTSDTANAEDICAMQGSVTPAPGSTEAVIWKVDLHCTGTTTGFTLGAPANVDKGSYRVDSSCHAWASLVSVGFQMQYDQNEGNVVIQNNASGNLTNVCSLTFGTPVAPLTMVGAWGQNYTATLTYGVSAGVALTANREEVEVGGWSSAGAPSGSFAAWGDVDGSGTGPVLLNKASDPTVDAVWTIQ